MTHDIKIEEQIDTYLEQKSAKRKRWYIRILAFLGVFFVTPMLFLTIGINLGKQDVTFHTEKIEVPVIQKVVEERYKGVSEDDIKNMALTILFEARSESMEGQLAVGHVINNRFKYDKSCKSISNVVKEPYQFSIYNKNDPNYRKVTELELYPHKATDVIQKQYAIAWKVSLDVLTGNTKDPTNGSTMYLNPKKVDKIPKWFKVCKNTKQIGRHHFCYYESSFCDR